MRYRQLGTAAAVGLPTRRQVCPQSDDRSQLSEDYPLVSLVQRSWPRLK